jgi:ribA/ribD-fused uncharacterized protein
MNTLDRIETFRKPYSFLSNFYRIAIPYGGVTYPSVEHAFQAAKTKRKDLRDWIAVAPTAAEAKRRGRIVKLRDDWDAVKQIVMLDLLRRKFANSLLAHQLQATGDAELVEGNSWHDNYWGSCRCDACGDKGQNELGKLLMRVRDELRIARYGR